jgi:hypothetical protein
MIIMHAKPKPQETNRELKAGDELHGLKTSAELPEGQNYWDQIIPSSYGELIYSPHQWRDGHIRWVTRDLKITVTVLAEGKQIVAIDRGE